MSDNLNFTKDDQNMARIRSQHIGFVFQLFNLIPRMTADPEADQEKFSDFTIRAIHRMNTTLPSDIKKLVLTDCACLYPTDKIQHIVDDYKNYKSSGKAHFMLEELFSDDLSKANIPEQYGWEKSTRYYNSDKNT